MQDTVDKIRRKVEQGTIGTNGFWMYIHCMVSINLFIHPRNLGFDFIYESELIFMNVRIIR